MRLNVTVDEPLLEPFLPVIRRRHEKSVLRELEFTGRGKSLSDCFNNHLYFGLHRTAEGGWIFREWAPNATAIYLIGDSNEWQKREDFRLRSVGGGVWELELPAEAMWHGMAYKLWVMWQDGCGERIPSYARRVVQDDISKIFTTQVWAPEQPYRWKNAALPRCEHPLIYEAHVGMSMENRRVATFNEFRAYVLPRIADLGYNMIQLMGIQEHPYYGSFGYQVSNFYAVSSRFGTPDDLKRLIDEAHGFGIGVIMDLVHSHAVKNEAEGLSCFAGDYDQYFYSGERGVHKLWNSRCFDYGKNEVIGFLLSNCKFWAEEFHFDGFRFDGITSMLYWDHGLGRDFTEYKFYYDGNQDEEAITYLTLANKLIHEVNPAIITIAEDMSGMPGLASPPEKGGIGFDFRMSMGVPDYWIKLIKDKKDEEWHVGDMFYELTNKRAEEHTISYAESHDQAMVGDKTIFFRLVDKDIYTGMSVFDHNLVIERGIALHKMIRLLTIATAGDGYLNFMGNEFGHPEWIDFPREGNQWSYEHARRQWSLADDTNLRFRFLNAFDKAMIEMVNKTLFFKPIPEPVVRDEKRQILVFRRGAYCFVFNFSPDHSYSDYQFETEAGKYVPVLDTDDKRFDGFGRIDDRQEHFTLFRDGRNWLSLYIPARTAFVLQLQQEVTDEEK
ncbi:MAG: alpha amylase C-terminal domain-containing protein [Odoribacter sp.]|nr:alpha amylase C-terminal domain-containing protein [Odoribacter sp.]